MRLVMLKSINSVSTYWLLLLLSSLSIIMTTCNAWTSSSSSLQQQQQIQQQQPQVHDNTATAVTTTSSRRNFFATATTSTSVAVAVAVMFGMNVQSCYANVPTITELDKLRLGHARIQYLLSNWDDITQTCGTGVMSATERKQVVKTEGGYDCTRTPLKVQEYMGYKSINDPLYKADKLMLRAGQLVDPDVFDEYLEVVERYREKADQTALLAYTSSWGESNPNGSKEVIDEYLEQTKVQVIESEKLLKRVLELLNLSTMPPMKGNIKL